MRLGKSLFAWSFFFLVFTFFISGVFALTANSSSYSVGMVGDAIATGTGSSDNYNVTFLLRSEGSTRNAGGSVYTGNIGFFDDTVYYRTVSIQSYAVSPSSAVVGSTIGLSISALNYQSIWAVITSPNSQEQLIALINGQTVDYVPSPSVVGTYNVIFYANSSTGAIASAIDSFELTAQSPSPSGGGGSGRGGTTTIIDKCVYSWDCTPWSVCSDGKQTRGCKNIGTCEGDENRPIEEMPCSIALFDISLELKNIELAEDGTLKFGIDLMEKMGVEKIDAHIKYSIIDSEMRELFSQIETKAIEGQLNYDKELGELGLMDGEYILRVDIIYGNLQRAFAEQSFVIVDGLLKKVIDEDPVDNFFKIIIISFVVILLVLFSFLGKTVIVRFVRNLHWKIGHKHSKDRIKGLRRKGVYTEQGDCIGKVDEIILGGGKIYSLRIRLKKKRKIRVKGIIVKYKDVKSVGHIVIVDERVLKKLDIKQGNSRR